MKHDDNLGLYYDQTWVDGLDKRIRELEEERDIAVNMRKLCEHLASQHYAEFYSQANHLRSFLKQIAGHPHCNSNNIQIPWQTDPYDDTNYRLYHASGHRCAAQIAQEALKEE
jgi:hypothetical protein